MNSTILENQTVERLARTFRRSPCQMNRWNESDAEIIRLGDTGVTLAITTDSIVEEIASGLYEAPYVIGWMAAMVNFSDLAAVGAAPAGLLIAETLPTGSDRGFPLRIAARHRGSLPRMRFLRPGRRHQFRQRSRTDGMRSGSDR